MTLEQWYGMTQPMRYRGHEIVYRDEGDGSARPVLLCIHGFPTASWDWAPIWSPLTRQYRVLAPDMIGFGYSDKPRNYDYSIHDQADLHEALLQEQGVSQALVLAHDYGDTVAQELLARQIDGSAVFRMEKLCFLNGGLFPEMHRARPIQKLFNSPLGFILSHLMGEKAFRRSFSQVFGPDTQPTDEELKAFWTLVNYKQGKLNTHKLIRYIEDRKQHRERWVNALKETPVPIRLIDGLLDPVSGGHLVEYYQQQITDADIVELPDVGHYPQVEAPDRVAAAVLDFFG